MPDSQRSTVLVLILSVALVASVAFVGVGFGQETGDGTNDTDANETEMELTTQSTSYLRIAHAAPGAGAVNVSVDNETVAEGVEFGTYSDYLELESGNHTVTVSVAGSPDEVVFNETLELEPRSVTTVTAAAEATGETTRGGVVPIAYEDNARTPGEDESAVRIVHLSPNAPAVDVVAVADEGADENATGPDENASEAAQNATGADQNETEADETEADENETEGEVVLAENVSYTNATEYMTVPAGDYTVEIREATADNDGAVVATADVSLESEVAYSAWALGNVPEDGEEVTPTFRVATTQDASTTIEFPSEMAGENESEMPDEDENETEAPGDNETEATETPGEEATEEETAEAGDEETTAEGEEATETEADT